MSISRRVAEYLHRSSWIRAMFEQGIALKEEYGEENVFDLSLGNPHLEPPAEFESVLLDIVSHPTPGMHRYMPNAGYPETREVVAARLESQTGLPFTQKHVVMTVGAAGGINVFLQTVLDPGDRVLVFAPFFPEYEFYIASHDGRMEVVETDDRFQIDVNAVERVMGPDVAAILVNSPNNPTGVVYRRRIVEDLTSMVQEKEREYGREIYIVADEPYRRIVYEDVEVPWWFHHHRNTVVATSHSKDLNLPGERIGYVAVHPEAAEAEEIFRGMVFNQRALGMVSAPALMQRVVARMPDVTVDVSDYEGKRNRLYSALTEMGYRVVKPEGAFYLFPAAPGGDCVRFIELLERERVLCVPGVGFGRAGYFRISYAVADDVVEKSLPGFERALRAAGG